MQSDKLNLILLDKFLKESIIFLYILFNNSFLSTTMLIIYKRHWNIVVDHLFSKYLLNTYDVLGTALSC